MADYLKRVTEAPVPQSEALPGMAANSAGGYAYPVDDMTRLRRFLILGSEGGSYYAGERKLTLDNIDAVKRCIQDEPYGVIKEIVNLSVARRAPKVGTLLFTLALVASRNIKSQEREDEDIRHAAMAALHQVAITGSHLQMFIDYVDGMRGWGRSLRSAVANWYCERPVRNAAYQAVKYRSRYNWTHRDLLRKAHPKTTDRA